MKPIAIVPRPGRGIRQELRQSIMCLRETEIDLRNAVIGETFALIWVDDEEILMSLEALRSSGLQATALTETDIPH
jgi:hypothetical protein